MNKPEQAANNPGDSVFDFIESFTDPDRLPVTPEEQLLASEALRQLASDLVLNFANTDIKNTFQLILERTDDNYRGDWLAATVTLRHTDDPRPATVEIYAYHDEDCLEDYRYTATPTGPVTRFDHFHTKHLNTLYEAMPTYEYRAVDDDLRIFVDGKDATYDFLHEMEALDERFEAGITLERETGVNDQPVGLREVQGLRQLLMQPGYIVREIP